MEQRKALPKELDHSPDPAELGLQNPSHQRGMCSGGVWCLERWKIQRCAKRDEETRAQQNRYRVAPARQTVAHECSGAHR